MLTLVPPRASPQAGRRGRSASGATRKVRAGYEKGIGQAEKFGHSGMAEDLRLVISGLGN